jgi:hypothetical protein
MRKFILLLLFVPFALSSVAQSQYAKLKEGDLVFQDLDCGPLCDAIEAVTDGYQGRDFSHVAILVKMNKELRAVEAIGSHVKSTSLDSLFLRCSDPKKYLIMRLTKENQFRIPVACKYAKTTIGKAYDDRFINDNDSLYCSELIYNAFLNTSKTENLFYLQPMTYKDPKTGTYFPAWIEYYQGLHSFIPEGLQGINPGLLSRSPYLEPVE